MARMPGDSVEGLDDRGHTAEALLHERVGAVGMHELLLQFDLVARPGHQDRLALAVDHTGNRKPLLWRVREDRGEHRDDVLVGVVVVVKEDEPEELRKLRVGIFENPGARSGERRHTVWHCTTGAARRDRFRAKFSCVSDVIEKRKRVLAPTRKLIPPPLSEAAMAQWDRIRRFADVEDEFIERAHRMVWGSFATVDLRGRPTSRVLHAIWERQPDGAPPVGWIATRRASPKARDIELHPWASLAYVSDLAKPLYVECLVEWADDEAGKQHLWDLFANAPPPVGYDPAPIFGSVTNPDFGALKLTPWRIQFGDPAGTRRTWLSR